MLTLAENVNVVLPCPVKKPDFVLAEREQTTRNEPRWYLPASHFAPMMTKLLTIMLKNFYSLSMPSNKLLFLPGKSSQPSNSECRMSKGIDFTIPSAHTHTYIKVV
jgi:hypothetical protein